MSGLEVDMTEFYICSDCAMWHANADVSGIDDEKRVAEVTAYDGFLDVDCGENGEHCRDFSWSACDACGTTLGGDRHRAFA